MLQRLLFFNGIAFIVPLPLQLLLHLLNVCGCCVCVFFSMFICYVVLIFFLLCKYMDRQQRHCDMNKSEGELKPNDYRSFCLFCMCISNVIPIIVLACKLNGKHLSKTCTKINSKMQTKRRKLRVLTRQERNPLNEGRTREKKKT